MAKIPTNAEISRYENDLLISGYRLIAGIDEAGRGPLAGPVVSACVVFDWPCEIKGVYDSKAISEKKREELYLEIISKAKTYQIGVISPEIIDQINIYQASRESMRIACERLSIKPDFVLIDAMKLNLGIPSLAIIKGDQKSFCIAAASIIAKVTRDRIMRDLHQKFPQYDWEQNKGYPTNSHRKAIHQYGLTPHHRKTFRVKI